LVRRSKDFLWRTANYGIKGTPGPERNLRCPAIEFRKKIEMLLKGGVEKEAT
jgi:hypothetical protein